MPQVLVNGADGLDTIGRVFPQVRAAGVAKISRLAAYGEGRI